MSGPTASRIAMNCSVTPRISLLSQFSSGHPAVRPKPGTNDDKAAVGERQDIGLQRTKPRFRTSRHAAPDRRRCAVPARPSAPRCERDRCRNATNRPECVRGSGRRTELPRARHRPCRRHPAARSRSRRWPAGSSPPRDWRVSTCRCWVTCSNSRGSRPISAGDKALDHIGQAGAAEAFVELGPADNAVVGGHLQERKHPPASVGLERLDLRDLHCFPPDMMIALSRRGRFQARRAVQGQG